MTATHADVATAINGHLVAENTIAIPEGYVYLGMRDWKAVIHGRVHKLASWRADADTIADAVAVLRPALGGVA